MKRFLAFVLLFLLLVIPAHALVKEGSDSKGKFTVEDPNNYPIIFIPGVAGSELYSGNSNAWPGWLYQRGTGGNFDDLAMDIKGRSAKPIVPLRSIRKGLEFDLSFLGVWGVFDVYDGFFDYMEGEGYSLDENKETGLRLYDFAYDWRRDNHQTANLLDKAIDKALKENKAEKVILMAHSMGGVVARLYMKDEARAQKVAGVIFLGTPHQGSPMPFYAYTHGYNFGNSKLSDTKMWELMGNWEAGYQLLPNYPFIQDSETGEFWPVEKIYGADWISQQEYEHYLDNPGRVLRYGLPNRDFASKVVSFQAELGDSLDKYPWVEYYMIEGVDQETVQYFIGTLEVKSDIDFKGGPVKPVLSLEKVTTKQGDGTVPARGAKVQNLDGAFTVSAEHGKIPSVSATHPILTDLRKKINDEDEKERYKGLLANFSTAQLAKVSSWPSSGSVFAALKEGIFGFFRPDPDKIKLREELRGSIKEMLVWAHANIVVAEGTEDEARYYVVVNDFEFVEAGSGRIKPATTLVKVDSVKTFDDILSGRMDIADAYREGKIKVAGQGFTNWFKLKVFEWFGKYSR